MKVDLISIGSELLSGLVDNSNAFYLAGRLGAAGVVVREQATVPDDREAIKAALQRALEHSDAALCTGGLGPTDDDLTREAVAELLGLPLSYDQGWLKRLEIFFAQRGYPMPEANRKQALVIRGGRLLDNPAGTAPGMILKRGKNWIFLLPGPPRELHPMFEQEVLPFLKEKLSGTVLLMKTLKCVGLGESLLEEKIKRAGIETYPVLSTAAHGLEVRLQLKAYGRPAEAAARLEESAARLRDVLGNHIYGQDDDTLAGAVAAMFVRHGLTLALAESCTGGLLGDAITDIPGSSRFFKGSLVVYSNEAKTALLGIDAALLAREGAVSEAVAKAMAAAAAKVMGAAVGVGVTGIAGPESDPAGHPAGLVYLGVYFAGKVDCKRLNLTGPRRAVKERAVQAALAALWRMMPADEKN